MSPFLWEREPKLLDQTSSQSAAQASRDTDVSASRTWRRSKGLSVHYWDSPVELKLCLGQEVELVGAGCPQGSRRPV